MWLLPYLHSQLLSRTESFGATADDASPDLTSLTDDASDALLGQSSAVGPLEAAFPPEPRRAEGGRPGSGGRSLLPLRASISGPLWHCGPLKAMLCMATSQASLSRQTPHARLNDTITSWCALAVQLMCVGCQQVPTHVSVHMSSGGQGQCTEADNNRYGMNALFLHLTL